MSVSTVASKLHVIGLSLNLSKCEYLSFNSNITTPLICGSFSILLVSSFWWLGINVSKTLKSLQTLAVADCKKKIQLSYSKIVANQGRYNRKSLAKLYSVFTDHSVLFLSSIYSIFHRKDISSICSYCFWFSCFLLYLPLWYRNWSLVSVYSFLDTGSKLTELAGKMSHSTYKYLPAHRGLIRLLWFLVLSVLCSVCFVSIIDTLL